MMDPDSLRFWCRYMKNKRKKMMQAQFPVQVTGNGFSKEVVRAAMQEFWEDHSQAVSLEEMMLDTNAQTLSKEELPEILSYLPDWKNKDVVELGAGIGRFTAPIASKARSVVAVDFMERFMKKNEEDNAKYGNIDFKCADVTKMDLPPNSQDLVFSNWLLMYLEDVEVQELIKKMLSWTREGGYIFIRESCFHSSGNIKNGTNPTTYRHPNLYEAFYGSTTMETEDGEAYYGLDLVFSKKVDSYMKLKNNPNQVVWLLQKVKRTVENDHGFGYKTFQEFLDNQQYSKNGILRYEKIFGRTFVSTGGLDSTKEIISALTFKKNQIVLDVGCGIGGSAFYMVKEYGVKVVAIDLSSNMIDIGIDRAAEVGIKNEVVFETADATKRDYPDHMFDIIYSRDTILHIKDKLSLFKKFYKWLKPGGQILITDYCCSAEQHTEQFEKYVQQRGYHLVSPAQYGQILEEAGFEHVRAEDKTDLFVESLRKELKIAEDMKQEFVEEFSQEDYDYIVTGWNNKIRRSTEHGDQRWGMIYAEKRQ